MAQCLAPLISYHLHNTSFALSHHLQIIQLYFLTHRIPLDKHMFRNSRSTPSTALDTATSAVTITTTATAATTAATYSAAPMSCTTHWHRCKKLEAETAASTSSAATSMTTTDTPKPRKVYSCQTCRQAMNKQTGHTQFKRKRCCPMSLVSQEEWL